MRDHTKCVKGTRHYRYVKKGFKQTQPEIINGEIPYTAIRNNALFRKIFNLWKNHLVESVSTLQEPLDFISYYQMWKGKAFSVSAIIELYLKNVKKS